MPVLLQWQLYITWQETGGSPSTSTNLNINLGLQCKINLWFLYMGGYCVFIGCATQFACFRHPAPHYMNQVTRCWSIKTRSSRILRPQKSLQQAILLGFFEFCWNPIAWNCWLSPWCWIGPQSQTKSPWMVGIAWIEGVKGIEGIDNLYIQLRIMIPSLSLSLLLTTSVYTICIHTYI